MYPGRAHPQHRCNDNPTTHKKVSDQNASECDPEASKIARQKRTPHELQRGPAAARHCGGGQLRLHRSRDGVGPLPREEDPPPLGLIPDPLGAPLERCSGQWVHAQKADAATSKRKHTGPGENQRQRALKRSPKKEWRGRAGAVTEELMVRRQRLAATKATRRRRTGGGNVATSPRTCHEKNWLGGEKHRDQRERCAAGSAAGDDVGWRLRTGG